MMYTKHVRTKELARKERGFHLAWIQHRIEEPVLPLVVGSVWLDAARHPHIRLKEFVNLLHNSTLWNIVDVEVGWRNSQEVFLPIHHENQDHTYCIFLVNDHKQRPSFILQFQLEHVHKVLNLRIATGAHHLFRGMKFFSAAKLFQYGVNPTNTIYCNCCRIPSWNSLDLGRIQQHAPCSGTCHILHWRSIFGQLWRQEYGRVMFLQWLSQKKVQSNAVLVTIIFFSFSSSFFFKNCLHFSLYWLLC